MSRLLFRGRQEADGGEKRAERAFGVRRPPRITLAGALLIGALSGCPDNPNTRGDGGANHNDAQAVCPTPGYGDERFTQPVDHPMANLGIIQQISVGLTPIDCVDHVTALRSTFSPGMIMDDLTRGKLAISENRITVFENEYAFLVPSDQSAIQLRRFSTQAFAVGSTFNVPSEFDETQWQVQAINDTTENVAGRDVRRATFQVLNADSRTPEETRQNVYLVSDPADYKPVYDAVVATGARVNSFAIAVRNIPPSTLEYTDGRIWVDPSSLALSVALTDPSFSFDIRLCNTGCGTLPYAQSGRDVTITGMGYGLLEGELKTFSMSVYPFKP
ncbi:MAG: hypothetical protein V1827_05900 [Candidatus Micrarchaeota archaeon]